MKKMFSGQKIGGWVLLLALLGIVGSIQADSMKTEAGGTNSLTIILNATPNDGVDFPIGALILNPSGGTEIIEFGPFFGGLDIDSAGNLFSVDDESHHRVYKYDSDGMLLTQWGSSGSGDGEFNIPIDVAVDNVNNVYITNGASLK